MIKFYLILFSYTLLLSEFELWRRSDVFRISVRRGGAVGVEGVLCGGGGWETPQKKISSVHFDAAFNRQKPRNTDFTVQSLIEAYKNSAKIIKKFTGRPNGVAQSPPEYATVASLQYRDAVYYHVPSVVAAKLLA